MGYAGYGFFNATKQSMCLFFLSDNGSEMSIIPVTSRRSRQKKKHLDWFEVGLKIYWKQRWFFPVQKEDVPAFPSSLGNAVCRGQTCPNGFVKVGK